MPDRKQDDSQTGKFQSVEDEPENVHQTEPPAASPQMPDATGSTTGILHAYHEGSDDQAERDEDQPAENAG